MHTRSAAPFGSQRLRAQPHTRSSQVVTSPRTRSVQASAHKDSIQPASGALTALAAAIVLSAQPAFAAKAPALPPVVESEGRCTLATLDIFADTRAMFSQEASSGAMTEANVDVRGCDFSNLDLTKKVMSGVLFQNANFSGVNFTGVQMARADGRGASLVGANFTDVNAYSTQFDGADLRDAQFENAILSSASFGQFEGKWANLKGAHFEGALLSSSDIGRICANPTLDETTRKYELGCRSSR